MKLLEGYVKNRTKEASIAAVYMALFFVFRTFNVPIPFFHWSLALTPVFAAASFLSWPYTIVFSLATNYGASTPFACIAIFIGSQFIFFTSKLVGKNRAQHITLVGHATSYLAYGLILQYLGMADARIWLVMYAVPESIEWVSGYIGTQITWKYLREFGLVD